MKQQKYSKLRGTFLRHARKPRFTTSQ